MTVAAKKLNQNKFLGLIILFISFDVLCDNYIAGSFNHESPIKGFCLFVSLLLFQIFVSPIQAGISDLYGRRLSLLVSMSFSLLSLIFVYLYDLNVLAYLPVLIIISVAKGFFGNTVPIAWSAVGDIKGKDLRFSFALATSAYAVGYLALIFLNQFYTEATGTIALIVAFFGLILLCYKSFFDLKDITLHELHALKISFPQFIKRELLLIYKDTKNRSIQYIFFSWILWEASIYLILVYFADFINEQSYITEIVMMLGYLLGTLSMKFLSHVSDPRMIRIGFKISLFSLFPYFVFFYFFKNVDLLLSFCYFIHAIGNAFLSATMFSIISKKRKEHERGKIYGLAESADTIAFLLAVIAIAFARSYELSIFFLVSLSFLTVCFSWIPYHLYEKISKNDRIYS